MRCDRRAPKKSVKANIAFIFYFFNLFKMNQLVKLYLFPLLRLNRLRRLQRRLIAYSDLNRTFSKQLTPASLTCFSLGHLGLQIRFDRAGFLSSLMMKYLFLEPHSSNAEVTSARKRKKKVKTTEKKYLA